MTALLGTAGNSSITPVSGTGAQNYLINETVGWTLCTFFRPSALVNSYGGMIARGNVADTVRPIFFGIADQSGSVATSNSLVYIPNEAGSWAISTTSSLTANHWYFAALTHKGTGTSSTTLSVWDLTSPAGQMATSVHGTMGGHDTDTTALGWAMGVDTAGSFRYQGYLSDAAFWTGVLTPPDIACLAYRVKQINDLYPQNLVWWLPFDANRLQRGGNTSIFGKTSTLARGVWSGPWINSVANWTYSPLQPPITGMPMDRANIIPIVMTAGAVSGVQFRKTLSGVGGRVGSRQSIGWGN